MKYKLRDTAFLFFKDSLQVIGAVFKKRRGTSGRARMK